MRLETFVLFVIATIGVGSNPSLQERLEYLRKVDTAVYENIVGRGPSELSKDDHNWSKDQERPRVSELHQRLRDMEDVAIVANAISSELSPNESLTLIEDATMFAVMSEYARLMELKAQYNRGILMLNNEIKQGNPKLIKLENKYQYVDRNMKMFSEMIDEKYYVKAPRRKPGSRSDVSTIFKQQGVVVSDILKNIGVIEDETRVLALFQKLHSHMSYLRTIGFQDSDIYSLLINTKTFFTNRLAVERHSVTDAIGDLQKLEEKRNTLKASMEEAANAAEELRNKYPWFWKQH